MQQKYDKLNLLLTQQTKTYNRWMSLASDPMTDPKLVLEAKTIFKIASRELHEYSKYLSNANTPETAEKREKNY